MSNLSPEVMANIKELEEELTEMRDELMSIVSKGSAPYLDTAEQGIEFGRKELAQDLLHKYFR